MPMTHREIRQSLLEETPNSGALQKSTPDVKSQLEKIHDEPYLNSEDLIQESVLKKLKLRLKDQMEMIVAQHQQRLDAALSGLSSPLTSVVQYPCIFVQERLSRARISFAIFNFRE